jgi:uncharacterized protein YraI
MAPQLSPRFSRSILVVAFIGVLAVVALFATPAYAACNCPTRNGKGPGGTVYREPVVNCRAGPGTNFARVGTVNRGEFYEFKCQATGTNVFGNTVWDKLNRPFAADCYVSDYYMQTGCLKCSNVPGC